MPAGRTSSSARSGTSTAFPWSFLHKEHRGCRRAPPTPRRQVQGQVQGQGQVQAGSTAVPAMGERASDGGLRGGTGKRLRELAKSSAHVKAASEALMAAQGNRNAKQVSKDAKDAKGGTKDDGTP